MILNGLLKLLIVLLWGVFFTTSQAQSTLYLKNASFEEEVQDATVPVGWFACTAFTTPDILPGVWGVYQEAEEGDTYLGLITRGDGTWESIGQRLPQPLKKKACYTFSLFLSHSNTYSGYNKAIRLRIWGGSTRCAKDQLLLETDLVEHTDWKPYQVDFLTDTTLNYITLEAFYTDEAFSRPGNILIDNISPIKKCARAFLER